MDSLLKRRRKQLGLTQGQVAERVGVSKATVSRWESGNIENMRRDRIWKLSKVLDLEPEAILEMPSAQSDNGYYLDPDVAEYAEFLRVNPEYKVLFDASKNISKEDIETVVRIMKGLS